MCVFVRACERFSIFNNFILQETTDVYYVLFIMITIYGIDCRKKYIGKHVEKIEPRESIINKQANKNVLTYYHGHFQFSVSEIFRPLP